MWADIRRLIEVGVLAVTVSAVGLHAQPGGGELGAGITFRSGQSVQPIFEGWTKNADGSFELHFGYLNRNFVEEPSVPIGPDNSFEPGPADRGQPGYFYPRQNRRVFSVTVPRDFGKRELVWTLKSNGKTEKAVGWLHPEWEVGPTGPTGARGAPTKNDPPTITVVNPGPATLQAPITLTASVKDDGVPAAAQGGRGGRGGGGGGAGGGGRGAGAAGAGAADGAGARGGRGAAGGGAAAGAGGGAGGRGRGAAPSGPPTFRRESPETTPVNVPEIVRQATPRLPGLSVTWMVWRGPGPVIFNPVAVAVKDGQAVATARFQTPGDYVLRARASDSALSTPFDVKVSVTDKR
jgi:hypothetical protein